MAYEPTPFTGDITPENILKFMEEEFLKISRALADVTTLELRPVYAAPTKPREGMIVCADGTNWNPGAGKGIYSYLSGSWVKLS